MTAVSRMRLFRLGGALLAATYGWWLIAYFRTMTVGNDGILMCLLLGLLYVFPISTLPFLGLNVRRALGYASLILLIAVSSAVVWASVEEFVVRQTHPTSQAQYVERWWPFQNHAITYSPDLGWQGQD